jgi:GNAT superfamily N-acetyltransferase
MTASYDSAPKAPGGDPELRRVFDAASATRALAILREAAAWAAQAGIGVWSQEELRETDFLAAAAAGELVLGFERGEAAATMLLQTADPVYWPEAEPNSALYIHKVAVRRASAGCGWLPRLIEFAERDARGRGLPLLRLDTIYRPKMQAMYERFGFVLLVEEPLLRYGRRVIRMERRA